MSTEDEGRGFKDDATLRPDGRVMARGYTARDPRTGKPIIIASRQRRGKAKVMIREGPWMALEHADILPLASGKIESVEVRWDNSAISLHREDGVRALALMIGREIEAVHNLLDKSLIDSDPVIRIAALEAFPLVAEQRSGALFEVLEVLLDDPDDDVRRAASICLSSTAPIFPSATYDMMERELRHEISFRKEQAWRGLKELAPIWPGVAVEHLDIIFQEPNVDLRRRGAKILRRILDKGGAAVWDLISWTLQDEDVEVRRSSANTLRPLAEIRPKIALIIAEDALFDPDEVVRERVIKCLNALDSSSTKFRSLVLSGVRHRDSDVRMACVNMIPRLFPESEARDIAQELLRQEIDKKIIGQLEDIIFESELEGDERQKNAALSPAVPVPERDREIMVSQGEVPFDRPQTEGPTPHNPREQRMQPNQHGQPRMQQPNDDTDLGPVQFGHREEELHYTQAEEFVDDDFTAPEHLADAIADDAMVAAEYESELFESNAVDPTIDRSVGNEAGLSGVTSDEDESGVEGDDEVKVDEYVITSGLGAGNDFDISDAEFDELDSDEKE